MGRASAGVEGGGRQPPGLGGQHCLGIPLAFPLGTSGPLCLAGRGPFPWFWPRTGIRGQASDRCSQPLRQGCSHQVGVLFLFIIKLLGTPQC